MRRTFEFDVLACPRCGGRLRLVALIEDGAVIGRILRHLRLPTDLPVARPPVPRRCSRQRGRHRPTSTNGPLSDGVPRFLCRRCVRAGIGNVGVGYDRLDPGLDGAIIRANIGALIGAVGGGREGARV